MKREGNLALPLHAWPFCVRLTGGRSQNHQINDAGQPASKTKITATTPCLFLFVASLYNQTSDAIESAIKAKAVGNTKMTGPSILYELYPKDAGLKSALINAKIPEMMESMLIENNAFFIRRTTMGGRIFLLVLVWLVSRGPHRVGQ